MDELQAVDIEEYMEYLKVYSDDNDNLVTNGERGLKRKMSALRSFYLYYYKREMIKTNPTLLVDMPKLHDKAIIRLDIDEVAMLLDYVETCGNQLTGLFQRRTRALYAVWLRNRVRQAGPNWPCSRMG